MKLGNQFKNQKNKTENVKNSTAFAQKISAIHHQTGSNLIDRTFSLPSNNRPGAVSSPSPGAPPTFIIKQAGSVK